MLIAHLKAHLVSGDVVDLLPVRHETDVKKEVTDLLDSGHPPAFSCGRSTFTPGTR